MKVGHAQQDGPNSVSRSGPESDSASDKAGSPAGAPSTSSSLPSPGTPAQSPHGHGSPAAAPPTPSRSFTQFGSGTKPRKVAVNGSTSSGWPERVGLGRTGAAAQLMCSFLCSSFSPFVVLNILASCEFKRRDIWTETGLCKDGTGPEDTRYGLFKRTEDFYIFLFKWNVFMDISCVLRRVQFGHACPSADPGCGLGSAAPAGSEDPPVNKTIFNQRLRVSVFVSWLYCYCCTV